MPGKQIRGVDATAVNDVGLAIVVSKQFRVAHDAVGGTAKVVTDIRDCERIRKCIGHDTQQTIGGALLVVRQQFAELDDTIRIEIGRDKIGRQVVCYDLENAPSHEGIERMGIQIGQQMVVDDIRRQ